LRVKMRCKKCGYEFEAELQLNPLGSLRPDKQHPASKIKLDKDSLDKLLESAKGASYEELNKIGLEVDPAEWEDAQERVALRRFLLEHLKVMKKKRQRRGERYVVATEPWQMGDSFKDVDLPSSEVKSLGIDDLRLIPGVTLQKKVYGITEGRDTEELKGVKFIVIVDVSGSMVSNYPMRGPKIEKALAIAKELYDLCRKYSFEYNLALFSDSGVRVTDVKAFWEDSAERAKYKIWNGGTRLATGLDVFSQEEYKESNVVIISDMEIADTLDCKDRLLKLAQMTNSFKIVIVEEKTVDLQRREEEARRLFPQDIPLQVMIIPVK